MTYPQRIVLFLLTLVFGVAGCDRNESSIRTYSAPKETNAPAPVLADMRNTNSGQDASVGSSGPAGPLHWTLPAGWKQVGGSSEMRYATIQVSSDDPSAVLTITPLGPEAAALLPNVVRWGGQLGIQGITEADLPKYAVATQVSGEPAHLVDITGQPADGKPAVHMLAAIIPHEGRTWFVKLSCPDSIAKTQKANFESFVHSFQFSTDPAADSLAGATSPGNTASPGSLPPSSGAVHPTPEKGSFRLASWTTPPGWTETPGSNAMRVTSFRIGSGNETAEVIVTRMAQNQTGSFLDNINRWRRQVGLEPVTEQKPGEMKPVNVAGHQALLLSFSGPDAAAAKQLVVSMDLEGSDFWFVKILGAKSVVTAQQDAFQQFLASMKFVPESN